MATKTSTLAVRLIDGISGPAKGAAASLKQVEAATANLAKVRGFREQTAKLNEMAEAHRRAREHVKNLGAALIAAENPSSRMKAAYERAAAAADKLGNKLEWQRARVRGAANAIEQMGHSVNQLSAAEMRLQANIDRTTAAMKRQEAAGLRSQHRRQALGTAAAAGGVAIGWRAREFGRDAIGRAASFDLALRQQQFATDIDPNEQRRVLVRQAERIGQDTKFTNEDVVRAQTEVANGLAVEMKKADILKPIIDQAKNYALTLKDVSMTDAGQAVRGFLLSLGKDISTGAKAEAEARRASNMMIRASKIGGMEHLDIQPLIQRGGSAARLVGLSDETILAMGVGMKRSNISGDQAGTALRTLSSKLANPTNKGMAALATAGIDYGDYTKMPGGMSVANYEKKFRNDFGKTLTPKVRAKLEGIFADEDVFEKQDTFAAAVAEAVGPLFLNKKGKLSVADHKALAKKAGEFHKFAVEAVDAERLLLDILAKDPSLGILNAMMTDKHGNKFGLLAKGFEQFMRDRADLKSVAPDYGDKASALITGGLQGAIDQLTGGIETLKQRLGTENEYWLTPFVNSVAGKIDDLTELVKKSPTVAAVTGGVAAGAAGIAGAFRLINDMLGGNAPAIALTASAASLTKSAWALDAAAAKLAAGSSLPGVPDGGKPGSKTGRVASFLGAAGLYGAGAYMLYQGGSAISEGNKKLYENVAPGEVHNEGLKRRLADTERRRAEIRALRQQVEGLPATGETAGAEAGQKAGAGVAAGITNSGPAVDAASQGIMARIKGWFSSGVDVPVRVQGSASPAAGPMTPPASTPAPNKQSYIRNDIRVTTGEGDPNKIAQAISQKLAAEANAGSHGAFSDYS